MFSIEQINDTYAPFNKAATFFEYVRALGSIDVKKYDSYLTVRRLEYFGEHDYKAISPLHTRVFQYPMFPIRRNF